MGLQCVTLPAIYIEAYSKFSPFCLLSILHSLQTVNTKKSRTFSVAPNQNFKEKENLKFSFMSQNILLNIISLCVCVLCFLCHKFWGYYVSQ